MKKTLVTLMLTASFSVNALVIDFSTMPSSLSQTSYSEDGFTINATSGLMGAFDNNNTPNSPVPPALLINGGSPASLTLSKTDNGLFGLNSFLGAEGRNNDTGFFNNFGSTGLTVEGFFGSGGSTIETINFDRQALNNSLSDFELFTLSGFNGLSSVTFTGFGGNNGGYSFNLDEIVVEAAVVPEPSVLALMGAGLVGLGFAYRRRKIQG